MNKRLISSLLAVFMVVGAIGCSKTTTEITQSPSEATSSVVEEIQETTETTEEYIEDASWDALESMGNIQTENGILYAYITLPASFYSEPVTQADFENSDTSSYTSVTVNEDGSVTFQMTRRQHRDMLDEIELSINDSLQNYVDDTENAITSITHTDDFSEYNIYLSTEELGMTEAFTSYALCILSGYYSMFSGYQMDDVIINYYNCNDELIHSTSATELATQE